MFGFSYLEYTVKKYKLSETSSQIIEGSNYIACNHMIDKFSEDKLFCDTKNYLVILDGVVINKLYLIKKMNSLNWFETIVKMYELYGDTFYDKFRGSFSGVIKDKRASKTIVFSDHIGSKIIYYVRRDDFLYVSSFMPNIYSFLKINNFNCSVSIEGAYMLLSHGYMLDDYTVCEQAKRIFPGHYLLLEDSHFYDKEYCLLTNKKENLSINDSVELIDSSFRKACNDEFNKDIEGAYNHLVSLSGGLDSRMTSLVADELGYKKQMNITFSQSGYWDETIPQKIAEDYHHDWLFKNLDSGYWLLDYEKIVQITGGNVLYYGQAHGNSLLSNMNLNHYGILHSGQLGDVFVGRTYSGQKENNGFGPYRITDRAYSKKYIERLHDYKFKYEYENREIGVLYNRGFNGMNNGIVCIYQNMETYSPFLDIDFIKTALKIPVCWDDKNLVYNTWICQKYPNFAKYGWEAIKGHLINEKKIAFLGRKYYRDDLIAKVKGKLWRFMGYNNTNEDINGKNGMNPLTYYICNYPHVYTNLDKYYNDNINRVNDINLKDDLRELYKCGTGAEKVQAITLIATYKLFFS